MSTSAGRLRVSLAVGDYDHVRDLVNGSVLAQGIDLIPSVLEPEEIFHRFTAHREWDVSEMSLGAYASLWSAGERYCRAIPVFPSRAFRHSAIYVRPDGRVRSPLDLRGARIGVAEWAQTAAIWVRGMLMEDFGLRLEEVRWYQAGVADPGRVEMARPHLPDGVELVSRPDTSLDRMLREGELDALISARPPASFEAGLAMHLWTDLAQVEADYWRAHRVFPIMHVMVIATELLQRHPWVARNLLVAFTEAKNRSLARLQSATNPVVPLPSLFERWLEVRTDFGPDPWPYGLDPNRQVLDTFLGFAAAQGVLHRPLVADELFAPETLSVPRR